MAEHSRLEDLRRRVERDPSSIAFAQLAEEYRRAGLLEQAVEVCRAGLAVHPGYLSARVTLGRVLVELGHPEDAQRELEFVLKAAPENLAAVRGLADIHHRRGNKEEALACYRTALALSRNDPDLADTVDSLARELESRPEPEGLSLAELPREILTYPHMEATGGRPAPEAAELPRTVEDPALARAQRMIEALERWLDAIHVVRAHQRA